MKSFIKNIFLVMLIVNSINAFSQRRINFILSIDEQIVGGSIMNMKIISLKQNVYTTHVIEYLPGELLIPDSTIQTILQSNNDSIILKFDYAVICGEQHNISNYEIGFKKSWVDNDFTVVSVFNTNNRKYRGKFVLKSSKNYVYDIYYPGGSSKTLRKGKNNNDCEVIK